MKRILIGLSIAVALVVTGPMNPLTASQNEASARIIKDCSFAFISLPLRGFYYPPANETKNVGRLIVEEDGDGQRNGTVTYEFNGLPPNSLATIWWVNLFMMTRQGAFPGFAPPSPQGNPYKGWTSGTAGPGYDTNGDGIILCGEGLPSFPPGSMYTKYQSPAFDQNAFCTDENGHSEAIITFPYDPTLTTIPAQIPPLLQTEVVPLKLVDGVFKLFNDADVASGRVPDTFEKRRHVVDMGYGRIFDTDRSSPRFGFQKVDKNGRPTFRKFKFLPWAVAMHYDGGMGFSHAGHPGDGPDDGPSPTVVGSDHEVLMAGMPTTQCRTTDAD